MTFPARFSWVRWSNQTFVESRVTKLRARTMTTTLMLCLELLEADPAKVVVLSRAIMESIDLVRMAGVMLPKAILGRSWLHVQSYRVAAV